MTSQALTTDLWQEAIKRHTDSLPEKYQKAFKAPSTVEQCMQILESKSSRKKGFTRILQAFKPLLDPLKRFEGAIDVVVQTNAGIGSPIWGPLRLAITVASDHFETLEHLTFVVGKITNSIQRVQDFEVLFASHEGVRKAIGLLYGDLVDFCTRVIRFYAKSFRYVFTSFAGDFGSVSKAIDLHSVEIDRAAAAAHMKEAKAFREKTLIDRESDALHKLQRWLTAIPMADELQNHLNEYMDGSCEWILGAAEFKEWYNAPLYSSLRIEGRPGCGKSTLAAYLVRHLSSSAPVLYFFCDGKNTEKRSTSTILRTLLSQLLIINPTLASALIPIQQQTGQELVAEYRDVLKAFQAVMKETDSLLYCVVDAVDECEWAWGNSGLVSTLQSLFEGTKAKLVITERDVHMTSWKPKFRQGNFPPTLEMRPEFAKEMIKKYASDRIQRIPYIGDTELGQLAVTKVLERSDGLWLYARLVIDEIEQAPSANLVRQRLASLPEGLSDLYAETMKSVESRMTKDHQKFAQFLYIWLDVSDYLPSFFASDYDRMPYETLELIFRYVNGGEAVFNAASLAKELGSPLVKVHPTNSTYELNFVHATAYQYLADSSKSDYAKLPIVLKPQRLKQLYRGVTAVWYFTESEKANEQFEALKSDSIAADYSSYFEMTYGLWGAFKLNYSLDHISPEEDLEMSRLCFRLITFLQSDECLKWFEMSTMINYVGNYPQLYDNILEALSAAKRNKCHHHSGFSEFSHARQVFFSTWAYIIFKTTPWPTQHGNRFEVFNKEPEGFCSNEIFVQIIEIAKKWSTKAFSDFKTPADFKPVEVDGATMAQFHRKTQDNYRRGIKETPCIFCGKLINNYKADKHYDLACIESVRRKRRQGAL